MYLDTHVGGLWVWECGGGEWEVVVVVEEAREINSMHLYVFLALQCLCFGSGTVCCWLI